MARATGRKRSRPGATSHDVARDRLGRGVIGSRDLARVAGAGMKSRGAVEFKRLQGNQTEKAARFGVNPSTISMWESGKRSPGRKHREEIHEDGGPKPEAWDELIVEEPPRFPSALDVDLERATSTAVAREADILLALVKDMLNDLRVQGGDLNERVRLAEKIANIMTACGKHTGAVILNERQILASPAWARIWDAAIEALDPWPDAMRALESALSNLRSPVAPLAPQSDEISP